MALSQFRSHNKKLTFHRHSTGRHCIIVECTTGLPPVFCLRFLPIGPCLSLRMICLCSQWRTQDTANACNICNHASTPAMRNAILISSYNICTAIFGRPSVGIYVRRYPKQLKGTCALAVLQMSLVMLSESGVTGDGELEKVKIAMALEKK